MEKKGQNLLIFPIMSTSILEFKWIQRVVELSLNEMPITEDEKCILRDLTYVCRSGSIITLREKIERKKGKKKGSEVERNPTIHLLLEDNGGRLALQSHFSIHHFRQQAS
jgi:hypothetical protein